MKILTRAGGWHHHKSASITDARTGLIRDWAITWRTQRHDHCGQLWGTVDGERAPFYLDRDGGIPRSYVAQCGNCGAVKAFEFYAHRDKGKKNDA